MEALSPRGRGMSCSDPQRMHAGPGHRQAAPPREGNGLLRQESVQRGNRRAQERAADRPEVSAGRSPDRPRIRGQRVAPGCGGEAGQADRAALGQNPKYAAARVGLGDLLRRQNHPDEARSVLEQAKAADPTNASVRIALSAVDSGSGKFAEALKELESLPRQNWTPRVALVAGQLNVQTRHFTEAVAALTMLKQLLPDLPAARYWLGHALLGLNRPDDALLEFRVAAQKAPGNALIRFGLAQGLLEARQPREALAELNTLAK